MVNQIRFHGLLAPAASLRPDVVPAKTTKGAEDSTRKNYIWADLMQRVFAFDVLTCCKCGGPMRLVATITDRETIRTILRSSGLSEDSP